MKADFPDFRGHAHPCLAVPCATCRARAGEWCHAPDGRRRDRFHRDRTGRADRAFRSFWGEEASLTRAMADDDAGVPAWRVVFLGRGPRKGPSDWPLEAAGAGEPADAAEPGDAGAAADDATERTDATPPPADPIERELAGQLDLFG